MMEFVIVSVGEVCNAVGQSPDGGKQCASWVTYLRRQKINDPIFGFLKARTKRTYAPQIPIEIFFCKTGKAG
ncbi:MAG: hypothetical protein IPL84_09140 [Chitinophagaceae bacterium]|nr:hypothetical protein [Chitinophagaceae bacterium]